MVTIVYSDLLMNLVEDTGVPGDSRKDKAAILQKQFYLSAETAVRP